ncbi:STAS/SEC14 domain-containing protein [Chachezhania antarctica]|uniref:STAS/SEC14 domain-containing protein n=1 Tax=Chachezhania antarctica TaxID=2340860 RepID=UPI000EAF4AC5|nr:STAS/SEC14 domain-containing protein [Chachezhania antarctica]
MIEVTQSGAQLTVRLSGTVTQHDYSAVLEPAMEAALKAEPKLLVLAVVGEDFQGYDMAAAWEDTKLGLSHLGAFDRIAICSDLGWVSTAVRAAAVFLPYPVKAFPLTEEPSAREWLTMPK